MKDKIAFVAVGQAGGNIGQIFEEKGYHVLYINTSQEDLDTLDHAKHKYHIPGGEGCNKDRHKAKQLVIDDFDQIEAKIEATLMADQLFVIFASGGGTGSGAGPMLADLLICCGHTKNAPCLFDTRTVVLLFVPPSSGLVFSSRRIIALFFIRS
jgi:cell division GTPase FtsZ